MSRLEELIAELCPDGVPFIPISEIGTLRRGKRFVHADAVDKGIPCIHYGELYTYYGISTVTTKSFVREDLASKLRYAHRSDVIIVGAGENDTDIGIGVAYLGDNEVAIHDACYILSHNMDPQYISYCLRTDAYHKQIKKYVSSGKICSISAEGIGKAVIPVPPVPVQSEIVKILDNFTELTARKKQYEYYRDKLMTFGVFVEETSNCVWRTLGEVCVTISSGKAKTKENYGPYPVYGSTGIIAHTNTAPYDKVKILVARVGANAGYTHLAHGKYDVSDNTLMLDVKAEYNLKYIYYQLVNANLHQYAKGGGQPLVTAGQIKQVQVPIPPLPIQERIVAILDRFDTLCNDLTSGLPAEIAARQKQYEYYRDKLLMFRPLSQP